MEQEFFFRLTEFLFVTEPLVDFKFTFGWSICWCDKVALVRLEFTFGWNKYLVEHHVGLNIIRLIMRYYFINYMD